LGAGFWKSTAEIERFWAVDRIFPPVLKRARAEALYAGWREAVRRTLTPDRS